MDENYRRFGFFRKNSGGDEDTSTENGTEEWLEEEAERTEGQDPEPDGEYDADGETSFTFQEGDPDADYPEFPDDAEDDFDPDYIDPELVRPERMDAALETRDAASAADLESAEAMIPGLEESVAEAEADVPRWRWTKGKIILTVILALLVALIAFRVALQLLSGDEDADAPLTNVRVEKVAYGNIAVTTPIAGRIESENSVDLIPLAAGEVTEVPVREGQYVSQGTVLFTIDNTQAQLEYQQAQNGVESAQRAVDNAQTAYNQMQNDVNAGTATSEMLDIRKQSLDSARSQLQSAQLSLQAASAALENYTVKAPMAGYVTSLNVRAGNIVTQAQPSVSIADTSSLILRAELSEYLVGSLHVGDQVDVYVESAAEEPFKGVVETVAEAPPSGSFTYPVKISVEDSGSVLRAGMFAEVTLTSEEADDVIVVPSDAVLSMDGEDYVVVLNSDESNSVKYQNVTVGVDNGTLAEIKRGLNPGERVVVKGQNYVEDGEQVRVVNQDEDTDTRSEKA